MRRQGRCRNRRCTDEKPADRPNAMVGTDKISQAFRQTGHLRLIIIGKRFRTAAPIDHGAPWTTGRARRHVVFNLTESDARALDGLADSRTGRAIAVLAGRAIAVLAAR